METSPACRICLNTDVKLYDMAKYKLKSTYDDLCGSNLSQLNLVPHYACVFCSSLLKKFASFKLRCVQAMQVLEFLSAENIQLASDHADIDRIKSHIALPYKYHEIHNIDSTLSDIKDENVESDGNEPNKVDTKEFFTDFSYKCDSDDEPLARKITVKRKREKNYKLKHIKTELNDFVDIDNDNVGGNQSDLRIFGANKDCNSEDFNLDDNNRDSYFDDSNKSIFDNSNKSIFDNSNKSIFDDSNKSIFDDSNKSDFDDSNKSCKKVIIANWEFDLITLSIEQQIEELLSRKLTPNYINSRYKCEFCYKGFMTEVTYKNHMNIHDESMGPYSCAVCQARSQGHKYTCEVCGASFQRSTTYLTHVRVRHARGTPGGPRGAACDACGDCFIGETGLSIHKKKAHRNLGAKIDVFECGTCGLTFKNEAALTRHRELSPGDICDTKLSWCEYCGLCFSSQELCREHSGAEHADPALTCDQCPAPRQFPTERALASHAARAHGAPRARALCVCERCGLTCHSRSQLAAHQRTHSGEKPYRCQLCHKGFSKQQLLQIHTRTHTGERPFQCAACPKAFKHKAALNRHHRVHTGARPYRCGTCGKTFSQSNSMKQHAASVHMKAPLYARKNKQLHFIV